MRKCCICNIIKSDERFPRRSEEQWYSENSIGLMICSPCYFAELSDEEGLETVFSDKLPERILMLKAAKAWQE